MMQQTQQMMQRMDHIATRAQDMSRDMSRQMTQARTQTRDQLHMLQQLCDNVALQSRETKRTMEQLHLMIQDQSMAQDPDMVRDMDRLRTHSDQAADTLQEMLKTIERIHARLRIRSERPVSQVR